LIPKFKEAGDWCAEHGLPESQCIVCNPEVETKWSKLNPAQRDKRAPSTGPALGPESSPIKPTLDEGWCRGHGVPESVCTRCNDSLIPKFKEAGDWCAGHGLPESQCIVCNPEVEAKWSKLNPAARDAGGSGASAPGNNRLLESLPGKRDLEVERSPRLLTGASDSVCQVDTLRVRFIDPSIVRKAGIEVERVQRRAMSASISVSAEVEFDATRLTRVSPRVAGIARGVPVQLGDSVAAGDLMAVVDSPALGEAKSRYIERAQNLKLAEADAQRASTISRGTRHMLDLCTPEASPKEIREALVESPVGEAKATLLRAHAALQLARTEAGREATLLDKSLSSEREYQVAQSALAAAEAEFAALREEIAFDLERTHLATERALDVTRSALEAAERHLHILGLTRKQIEAIGGETSEMLSRFVLRSPVAGRMWLIADVYERDLRQLRDGLALFFTVDGMPGVSFEGRITWISSQVNDRTRTVRVRAELTNPDRLLRAKMFGQARIVLHDGEEVVSVPAQAVQTDGCCQLVFVQESETVFQPRKVALGASANGFVEVLKGLREGEAVEQHRRRLLRSGSGKVDAHAERYH
jgi:cobalt-zinc-cadmium efflux system membrane fusion protein